MDQPAKPTDPEASLRENLQQQIASAQADIETNLETLSHVASAGNELPLLQAQSQLQGLGRLQQRLANARGGELVALRAEITASIAATQLLMQQSRAATTTQTAEAVLREASQAAHREVAELANDYYEHNLFQPYLRFTSVADEEAFRKREAERQQLIADELAKGTPQGDLAAANAMAAQMDDAEAHGAGDSPDFKARTDRLKASRDRLVEAISPDGLAKGAAKTEVSRFFDTLDPSATGQTDQSHGLAATVKASGADHGR
ncbi:hypothetical protein QO010_000709 [Caulobacter ginsengisoli]|uniref:Uncharacterized protein n=1 Tax=Caulobacter ginsengisoli TaxID=400775 RepID=A0ABU0INH8_9CAUL|nr:hypothetical protein [Caulobacter ginsengisoli]MDQ0462961.1 hypothetical protein [Caulobacter ginsengisoli]